MEKEEIEFGQKQRGYEEIENEYGPELEEVLDPADDFEPDLSEVWHKTEIDNTFGSPSNYNYDRQVAVIKNGNKSTQEQEIKGLIEEIEPPGQIPEITTAFNEKQYILVKYGTLKAMACIDTGSFISIMDKVTYDHVKNHLSKGAPSCIPMLIKYNKPVVMDAVNGGALEAIGWATLKTTIGTGEFDISYQVVTGIPFNIILGRDFMRRCGMEINFKTNTVKVSPYIDLYATGQCILPPHTDREIVTQLSSELDIRGNGTLNLQGSSTSIKVKDGIGKLNNGIAKIVAHNQTDEPIIIQQNSKILVAKVIPEVDNVLQYLSECLKINRERIISEQEGVTHGNSEYWETINKINLDDSILSEEGRYLLFEKIFSQRGAMSISDQIGCLRGFKYEIRMKEHEIFNKESYRVNSTTRTILEQKINHLRENGVVRQYMSEYSSPALLVKKPSSKQEKNPWKAKYRVVIDLREMNERSIHLQYSLPIIHETVTELNPQKFRYYSLMDVSDAFYQVQLHPNSYKFTTFKIPNLGSYCLTRLPQGYVGSPSIFQAIIENIFPDDLKKYITCYIDDILVMTETEQEHLEVIERVLETLRKNGLKLKVEKCQFCPKELDFLGITLCKEGVKVKVDKCEAIVNTKIPRTKRHVRSFLGAVGYYRRYIKDFAKIAKPLHRLTKDDINNKHVPWNEECQQAFDALKEKLVSSPILGRFDTSRQTILRTDSSGVGIGATLSQIIPSTEGKDQEYVIAYYSRVLQPHEYNYNITEREALAILSAVRNFATYLRNSTIPFLIKTDHSDLKYIFKSQKKIQESHRLIRWAMYLAGFNFNIQFCPGTSPEIRMVDFLSRNNYEDQNEDIGEVARSLSVGTLQHLEENCSDCSIDVSDKVAERITSVVPDVERISYVTESTKELIGNVAPSARGVTGPVVTESDNTEILRPKEIDGEERSDYPKRLEELFIPLGIEEQEELSREGYIEGYNEDDIEDETRTLKVGVKEYLARRAKEGLVEEAEQVRQNQSKKAKM